MNGTKTNLHVYMPFLALTDELFLFTKIMLFTPFSALENREGERRCFLLIHMKAVYILDASLTFKL
jgi:hypothetical protein